MLETRDRRSAAVKVGKCIVRAGVECSLVRQGYDLLGRRRCQGDLLADFLDALSFLRLSLYKVSKLKVESRKRYERK